MFISSLLFWVIAFIALKGDYKNPTNRWFSATAFFSGFGGIPVVWRENILPYLNFKFNGTETHLVNFVIGLFTTFPYYVAPYTFLMLGIAYTNLAFYKRKKVALLSLLIPTISMYIIYPVSFKHTIDPSFIVLSIWVVPYIVFSNVLIVLSILREKVPVIKRQQLYVAIVTVPVTMYALVTSYIMPACGISGWRLTLIITILQFIAFSYLLANFGVMGAKIKFEKNNMDTTMKAITSGNAILNHTIKNQINKILMGVDNLNASIKEKDADVIESIGVISNSTKHMMEMVKRIQEKTADIVLNQDYHSLFDIVEQSVSMINIHLQGKNIFLTRNYSGDDDTVLYCDIIHVKEIISNVLKNSIEAMDNGGKINIGIYVNKKWIVVEIKDNGVGIPKEYINKVIQPFFSTKSNQSLNFGLGLSYCYNTMIRHGGALDIKSEENVGTTVYLNFPRKNILKPKVSMKVYRSEA